MPHDSAQPTSGSHTLVDPDLGRIDVRTLPLPDSWRQPWGTYSSTGTVLVAYRTVDPRRRPTDLRRPPPGHASARLAS